MDLLYSEIISVSIKNKLYPSQRESEMVDSGAK